MIPRKPKKQSERYVYTLSVVSIIYTLHAKELQTTFLWFQNLKWREEHGINELAQSEFDPEIEAKVAYFYEQGTGGIPGECPNISFQPIETFQFTLIIFNGDCFQLQMLCQWHFTAVL